MLDDWMAVVLAGGIGTRLFPLTQEMPKPLLPIGNRSMIEYTLQMLIDAGIKKIVVAVKYLGDQIEEWIESQDYGDIEIIISNEASKDTADAVRLAAKHIDRNFIVTMADIITNLDLKKAIQFHNLNKPLTTICLKPVELPGQFGLTMIDNEHRIHLFLEKPSPPELLMTTLTFTARKDILHMESNLANIGIYICDRKLIDIILEFGDLMDFGKNVFPFLLDQKFDVRGFLSNPYWMDAGTLSKYIWANNDIARKWSFPYIPLETEKENDTGLWIGNDVKIAVNATISPPCVIGNGTVIDENSEIGPFVTLGAHVNIGKNVRMKQTVVLSSSTIKDNVRLNKTILSKKVIIEEGLILTKMVIPSNVIVSNSDVLEEKYGWK